VCLQSDYDGDGHAKSTSRFLGLHIAERAYRPPYDHIRQNRRLGICVTVQVDMVPSDSPGLPRPAVGMQSTMYARSRDSSAALIRAVMSRRVVYEKIPPNLTLLKHQWPPHRLSPLSAVGRF
jgi:hypothetical protein